METHVGKKRLRGSIPKIGIRPTIDGRMNGVRESLEDQTINLATDVADFLSNNLKHPNGMKVECVVTPTIGGVAEAAQATEIFVRENVGVSITVTPCWCYGSETMDMDPCTPKAILGFNGTERPGAVYLAAVLAAHAQKGLPAFGIYGHNVQDADDRTIPYDVKEKLLTFAKVGLAVAWMRGKSYISMGGVSMGIAGSIVNDSFFEEYLGMRVEYIDMSEFIRRMNEEIYDKTEYEKAIKWVKENCKEGPDANDPKNQWSREKLDETWEIVVKMTMIARDIMVGNPNLSKKYGEEALGHNAILAGFQGQRQWTDFMPNGDFLEAILNSSFDWNGIRQPYLVATENDCLNGVSMLFGHLLTNSAQIFADVRTYWSPEAVKRVTGMELPDNAKDGIIHLINSGAATLDGTGQQFTSDGKPIMKPFWEITEDEVKKCLNATRWRPATREYFRGCGFSSNFLTKGGMPLTMSRISLVKGLGPIIQIAEGWSVDLPENIHQILDERTDPTWPTTWFVPRLTEKGAFRSVYDVMNNWSANHAALCYGHVGRELIVLSALLRIPVAMHNVPEEKIFRPNDWKLFGTGDLEGADYRACKNYGPLYGKNK